MRFDLYTNKGSMMRDSDKSKTQLIEELRVLRERLATQDRCLTEGGPVYAAMEGLFGGVFQDLQLVLYRADHQAERMEYFSASSESVLNLSRDEVTIFNEEELLNRVHPDDRDSVRRARRRCHQQARDDPSSLGMIEARWEKTPGEWIWIRCRFLFVLDSEGEIFIETGTVEDITDQKQAAAQLREVQQEREVILNSISELVVYHDLEMNIVWINRAAAESLGISPAEAVGKTCHDLWQKSHAPCEGCPVSNALQTRQAGEFEISTPDGRIWLVRGYPSFNGEGELIGATEVTWDVTEIRKAERVLQQAHDGLERRVEERTADLRSANVRLQREIEQRAKAQEALRQQEEQFRALAETVPACVFIVQGDRFTYMNPAMEQTTGYTREELYAGTYWEHLHPEYRDIVKARAEARVQGKDVPQRYEMKYIRKDGSVRWLDASMSMVEFEGAPAIFVSAMDTTERRENEERLRDAHMQLLNAREEERRHLAGELHDSLAQDLVVLQLVLQCGTAALQETSVPQEWLTEATAMCTKMISDIRRLSHGLYPPMLETLGLHKSLLSLAEQYEVAGRKVDVNWWCAKDRRYSRPVEITLFRIVQEAMSNAVRHGLADQAEIHVSCTGHSIVLEVIDNGRGFEGKDPQNMGLGMRSMQDRLSMVDGTLKITSQPGRTCVRVEIPGIVSETIESGPAG